MNQRIANIIEKGDTRFNRSFEESKPWVKRVRAWFESFGRMTVNYPDSYYADGKPTDIHDMGVVRPFEVKQLHREFSCLEDLTCDKSGERGQWPLLIVDIVEHVRRGVRFYNSVAERYWFWNEDGSAALWLDVETSLPFWCKQWLFVDGRWKRHFMVPLYWDDREGRQAPIYTRSELHTYWVQMRRWPPAGIGVKFMTGEELDAFQASAQQNVKVLARMMDETRWMHRGQLQEKDPGEPKD